MTEKLYYDDAALSEFSARIVAEKEEKQGVAVCLDRTAFYPTSGGQPYDTGTLNGAPVVDVWEDEAGEVWHLLSHRLDEKAVTGRIDTARRFDHMQQHTGQHLLSAAFHEVCGANTIGFHLGSASSTIDLDIHELSWETAYQVEHRVNQIVWEDRLVNLRYVNQEQASEIPFRKPPQVTGTIRVIWVEGFDASACGGTHVKRSGQVGLIKIIGIERYKGDTRVSFLCGKRALDHYQQSLRTCQVAAEKLTVAQAEVPVAIERLQEALASSKKAFARAQTTLLDMEADRLWKAAPVKGGIRQLVSHWTDWTFTDIRRMANQLREHEKTFVLFSVAEEKGSRFVCARSDDLDVVDARQVLNLVLEKLNGRGGGSPALAQGGADMASPEHIERTVNDILPLVFRNPGG